MRRLILFPFALLALFFASSEVAARGSKYNYSSSTKSSRISYTTPRAYSYKTNAPNPKSYVLPKNTYKSGSTKYIIGETYKTTGQPKVERSQTEKKKFLKSMGYGKTPAGYEVDHIQPLSKGGVDATYNMQLLSKEAHHQKTAQERKK